MVAKRMENPFGKALRRHLTFSHIQAQSAARLQQSSESPEFVLCIHVCAQEKLPTSILIVPSIPKYTIYVTLLCKSNQLIVNAGQAPELSGKLVREDCQFLSNIFYKRKTFSLTNKCQGVMGRNLIFRGCQYFGLKSTEFFILSKDALFVIFKKKKTNKPLPQTQIFYMLYFTCLVLFKQLNIMFQNRKLRQMQNTSKVDLWEM